MIFDGGSIVNILVTGSNGFIGSNVCKYLKKQGCYVIGLDLAPTRATHSQVDAYVQCDLSSEETAHIFDSREVDAVVHLASDMRHDCPESEIEVVYHNCVGMQRLLAACEANHVKVLVQLSSLPVIGRPEQHPITEMHPLKPPTVYHATKIMQEVLANYAAYTHGLRTVSCRISAPVGIGMNPRTIFPIFIRRALLGEDIVLYGHGKREQTYIHVDDIAQAIYKAILSDKAQGVYNLGSYNRISNAELAQKCVEVLNSTSRIVYNGQEDPQDNDVWDMSLERLQKDTGYEPVVSIAYAIREQAEEIKKHL